MKDSGAIENRDEEYSLDVLKEFAKRVVNLDEFEIKKEILALYYDISKRNAEGCSAVKFRLDKNDEMMEEEVSE